MKNALAVLCSLILLTVIGCFDSEEHLVVNSDLSGTAQIRFEVQKSYLEQMQKMSAEMAKMMPEADIPSNSQDLMFNEAEIKSALAADNLGIKLVSYVITEGEKTKVWDMKFTFEDVNKIYVIYDALSPDEEAYEVEVISEDESDKPIMTRQADGTWLYLRPLDGPADESKYSDEGEEYYQDDQPEESGVYVVDDDDVTNGFNNPFADEIVEGLEQLSNVMEGMMQGMEQHTLKFVVTFPGEIIESNATTIDGNTATWEYTFEQLSESTSEQRAVIK